MPPLVGLAPNQLNKACACAVKVLEESSDHQRIAKQAQAGVDAHPGTEQAQQLQTVINSINAGASVK